MQSTASVMKFNVLIHPTRDRYKLFEEHRICSARFNQPINGKCWFQYELRESFETVTLIATCIQPNNVSLSIFSVLHVRFEGERKLEAVLVSRLIYLITLVLYHIKKTFISSRDNILNLDKEFVGIICFLQMYQETVQLKEIPVWDFYCEICT